MERFSHSVAGPYPLYTKQLNSGTAPTYERPHSFAYTNFFMYNGHINKERSVDTSLPATSTVRVVVVRSYLLS